MGVKKSSDVLFTYLTMRTIQRDLAGNLSIDDNLLALHRFNKHHGTIEVIKFDNGTNFVRATNEIKTCLNQVDQVKKNHIYGKNIK